MKNHTFTEDLLSKMTLDEKIVQVSCIMPIKICDGQEISLEKMKKEIPLGVGRITQFANVFVDGPKRIAKAYNEIQRYHIENTRLGIPVLMQNESAVGLNAADATIFPTPIGMAATWEPEMVEQVGRIIGDQAKAVGIRKCLSPVSDVARDARWGRVGETFGEDPTLVTAFSIAESKGIQGNDYGKRAISCAKHFMGYGASEAGNNCAVIHMGKKELKEVYGMPFAGMIHENDLQSVMVTYSEIDGLPMSINNEFVNHYLRDDLEFTGSAICDGQSIPFVHHTNGIGRSAEEIACRAAKVGIDADTPMTEYYSLLKNAIESGKLEEEVLDQLVRRVLNQKYELGLFEHPYVDEDKASEIFFNPEGNILSKKLAEKSMTLLKNEKHLLPLKDSYKSIGVVGPFADNITSIFGGYAYPSHLQGLYSAIYDYKYSMNGGFGEFYRTFMDMDKMAKLFKIDSKLSYEENLEKYLRNRFHFTSIYEHMKTEFINSDVSCFGIAEPDIDNDSLIEQAVNFSRDKDVIIVCAGEISGSGKNATSGEGKNTQSLKLPGIQSQLIQRLSKIGKPIVLVLLNGRGMEITEIEPFCQSILETYNAGPFGPEIIAKVLHGKINPCGKLPITFPRISAQCPIYYGFHTGSGYHSITQAIGLSDSGFNDTSMPLYCFGHGLSYTTFRLFDLKMDRIVNIDGQLHIEVSVENTGLYDGDEIVQIYFRTLNPSINRPFKELRAFKRVHLKIGEQKRLKFTIPIHALAYYNEEDEFVVEPADVQVNIGESSESIQLTDQFEIIGQTKKVLHERAFLFDVKEIE